MAEVKGITQSLELIDALKLLVIDGKKITADGKIGFSDFPVLFDLMGQAGALLTGFKGANEIPAEVADLSSEEISMIAAKFLEIVAILKGA